jgi:hypothetical protein
MSGKLIPRADGSSTLPSSIMFNLDRRIMLDRGLIFAIDLDRNCRSLNGITATANIILTARCSRSILRTNIFCHELDRDCPAKIINLFLKIAADCRTIFERLSDFPQRIGMNSINPH